MGEQIKDDAALSLMHEMGINEAAIERRKKIVALGPADVTRIVAIGELVRPRVEQYAATFFDHLATLEEARPLMANRALLDKAKQLKIAHLAALVSGDYGPKYVEERLELGLVYARAGLDPRVFLGAFHHLLRNIGTSVMQAFERKPREGFDNFMSLKKVAFFDIGLIVDVLVFERERIIRQQQEAIRELSTPVLQIRERMLLLPIIGVIDPLRARQLTEQLLRGIRTNRAKVVVIDITGVAAMDATVANHLVQTVEASRLLGAMVIVTGLSPEIAQTLVTIGVDLSEMATVGDLQGGIEEAERLLGYKVLP